MVDRKEEDYMPIHEYRCINCDEINEFLIGMGKKDDSMVCKKCGGEGFKKIMSSTNFAMDTKSKEATVPTRCCGSEEPKGDCTPGMCCGVENK